MIQGSGGLFCSGGGRDELAEICGDPSSSNSMDMTSRIYAAYLRLRELQPRTIAAVRGGVLGSAP